MRETVDTTRVNTSGIEIEREAILARMGEELELAGPAAEQRWPAIRASAADLPRRPYGSVILTGCGDSYYASIALRGLVEAAAGVPVLALPAMEAVTYPPRLLDSDALLVGISVSGKVVRTIEAVTTHRRRGGLTAAISAFSDSDVAGAAHASIPTGLRGTPGPVPGTANFLGSMLGIVAVAAELGDRRGDGADWESEVPDALAGVSTAIHAGESMAREVAAELGGPFCSLGSGPDLGTAWYGVAKFLEAAAAFGVGQDLEEWAHEQYFTTTPGAMVFVHATTEGSLTRARRVGASVLKVGGRLISIAPEPLGLRDEVHWPIARVSEPIRPLVAWIPMALSARAYAIHANRYPFGIDLPNRMKTVDDDIYLADPART